LGARAGANRGRRQGPPTPLSWWVGEVASAARWLVSGANGEKVLHAEGKVQAEAWHRACEQAAAVGMLAKWHEEE
jgi:hypothetical protein